MATLAFAALLSAPTAIGDWMAFGAQEPDTTFDSLDGYMFLEPNTDPLERAYLSVVPTFGHIVSNVGVWANPNVGDLGSRIYPPGTMRFDAIFGTWIDCNGDGYIGHAETVLMEYPSNLLPQGSVCANLQDYNQQGNVAELRWFSNDNLGRAAGGNGLRRDGRSIIDDGATIWGDFGVPGNTMGREICPRPGSGGLPATTTQRTGAFLNFADCFIGHQGHAMLDGALDSVGLGWQEEGNFDEEGHPLNVWTFGPDNGDDSIVHVWDCDTPRERFQTGEENVGTQRSNHSVPGTADPVHAPWVTLTDEEGAVNVTIHYATTVNREYDEGTILLNQSSPEQPRPVRSSPGTNPDGTVAGTYNATYYNPSRAGDCEETDGSLYDNFEDDVIPENSDAKNRVTIQFVYYEEQRNGFRARGAPWYGTQVYPLVRTLNTNGGGTHWYAGANSPSELGATGPTAPQLIRTSNLQPEGALYWTFYANLTDSSLSRGVLVPPSAPGLYGTEWCGSATSGVINGFVCDKDLWYLDANGNYVGGQRVGGYEYAPVPGQPYHLRDVDCYDGTLVEGVNVRASLADLNDETGPCPVV